jgi:hypothetical protein
MNRSILFAVALIVSGGQFNLHPTSALAQGTPSAPGAVLYIIEPADGDTVSSPVTVKFGLTGFGVAPALVEWPNTGHHHVLIDTDLPPMQRAIPAENPLYVHFGGGQTEGQFELTPGQHTLQLLLGDHGHIPHDPPLKSDQITITVK